MVAQGYGVGLLAFGSAYWPLAIVHSDPLWVRACLSGVGCPRDNLLPMPLTRCIQMNTQSPCWVCRLQH